MSKTETPKKQMQPPYGSVKWYNDFFKLLERLTIDNVDASFLKNYKIANGNEYKVISGLKFLGLIDEDGKATEKMRMLKLIGEDYTKNLEKIVRNAYSVLLKKVTNLEIAEPKDVTNCLINDYKMARSTARMGTKIFVFLADKAKIPISESLTNLRKPELEVGRKRRKKKKQQRDISNDQEEDDSEPPNGMLKLEYGKYFKMFLRKGNRNIREKTARIAKRFIETYVEEEETE